MTIVMTKKAQVPSEMTAGILQAVHNIIAKEDQQQVPFRLRTHSQSPKLPLLHNLQARQGETLSTNGLSHHVLDLSTLQ